MMDFPTLFSTDLARRVQGISRPEIIAPYVFESSPLVMCLAMSIRTSLFVGRLRTLGVKHTRSAPAPKTFLQEFLLSPQQPRRFPPSVCIFGALIHCRVKVKHLGTSLHH
jgi:hypothetical protein